jgi:hypothetical protein
MISWYVIVAMLWLDGSTITMKAIYDTEADCLAGAAEFRTDAPSTELSYECKHEVRSSK